MKLRKSISDIFDIIAAAVGTALGLLIVSSISAHLDEYLLKDRGVRTVGGEAIFYAAILGIVIYVVFQVVSLSLHYWYIKRYMK